MRFEWDEAKAIANLLKHGVAFDLAEQVWRDPFHLILPDRISDGEQRWLAIGLVRAVTILVVAHTMRGEDGDERVRIISARRATRSERRQYDEG